MTGRQGETVQGGVVLGCADFASGVGCCNSCHDDEAEGFALLMDYGHEDYPDRIPEGSTAYVCCDVALWLDEPTASSGGHTEPTPPPNKENA